MLIVWMLSCDGTASSSGSSNTGMSAMLLRIKSAELKDAKTSGIDSSPLRSREGGREAVDSTVARTFAMPVLIASSFSFCFAVWERVETRSPLGGRSAADLDRVECDLPVGAELPLRGAVVALTGCGGDMPRRDFLEGGGICASVGGGKPRLGLPGSRAGSKDAMTPSGAASSRARG